MCKCKPLLRKENNKSGKEGIQATIAFPKFEVTFTGNISNVNTNIDLFLEGASTQVSLISTISEWSEPLLKGKRNRM